jgi:5-formyltetrahydrofolate cyclo-ligase
LPQDGESLHLREATVGVTKAALRSQLAARRAALTPTHLDEAGEKLAAAVLPALPDRGCVACYVDVPPEPPTGPLLAALLARGYRVLLPILRADRDLGWGEYDAGVGLVPARWGLREPAGPDLGTEAIGVANVVIVPAVAVARDGVRLGRGGGSYDRALSRTTAPLIALLHNGELLPAGVVPAEPHDRLVHAVVTPSRGLERLPA